MTAKQNSHPDRDQMLKAIDSGRMPFRSHLERCEHCRLLYELLSCFRGQSPASLEYPSHRAVDRAAVIPVLVGPKAPLRTEVGRLVFDSWQHVPAAQLRAASRGLERRLRFSCRDITFEVVAERRPDGWEFSARVYRGDSPSCRFVLRAGRLRLLCDEHECFFWSGRHLPQKLVLLSSERQIAFAVSRRNPGGYQ